MIAVNVKHHVHFPRNVDEWNIIKDKFYQMYKMPGIGGCIDCTHIKIQNPGGPDSEVFRNRKGYFSLNVQVCYNYFKLSISGFKSNYKKCISG